MILWGFKATTPALLAAALAVTIVGIWAGGRVEARLGTKDPSAVVIDEVAGMILSVVFLPATPAVFISAFLLFRLFDIVKPYPARQWQAHPGGAGIMLDDLVAGIYANLVLQLGRALIGFPR